jgi:hypothetical protein
MEMADGSAPRAPNFDAKLGAKHPLGAFSILAGGDAFEMTGGRAPAQGKTRAAAYAKRKLRLQLHGAAPEPAARVTADVERLLGGSLELLARMEVAKDIDVDLIPAGAPFVRFGYPKGTTSGTVGLFWDDPAWPRARIALRQEKLAEVPQLTVHEMAHAIHFLAFTADERELVYRTLLRTYRSRPAIDEAFAIYAEREFLEEFSAQDKRAPGVYGFARQRWSEDHVFTRFVRNLFFPYKPLAGPSLGSGRGFGFSG